MRTSSFRTLRSTSGISKRPRSPPSPSSFDRPNKRMSLGGAANSSSLASALSSPVQPALDTPALRARQISEDWVSRTRVLKIDRDSDSPVITEESTFSAVSERKGHGHDRLSMDEDEPMSNPCPPPNYPQPSTSIHGVTTASFLYHSPELQSTLFSPVLHPSESSRAFSPIVPSATPVPSLQTQDSTPPSSSTLSVPIFSTVQIRPDQIALPSSPTKKQRFTMGPRSDCEKCRLGVPGHYSHLN